LDKKMKNGNLYKAILVPVDGSEQSFETIRYAGKIVAPRETGITLFHVISPDPRSFLDFQRDPPSEHTTKINQVRKKNIEKFLEKASAAFHQQGIPPKNIKRVIQARERGIARDILSEALRGYDAVVIGRWRYKAMENQIMGGTANKIVNNLYNSPVWLVGARHSPGKVLIAMDSSAGAMRAFNYAQKMLLGSPTDILLCSVIRKLDSPSGETDQQVPMPEYTDWRKQAQDKLKRAEEEMQSRFIACVKQLKQARGDAIRVRSKIVTGLPSRAEGIVTEARRGGYDTLIMGRRGRSDVRQYAMGQVCQKVLTMATDMAVGIVN
jgi:nucleotide-binding universal stress UspA family protein